MTVTAFPHLEAIFVHLAMLADIPTNKPHPFPSFNSFGSLSMGLLYYCMLIVIHFRGHVILDTSHVVSDRSNFLACFLRRFLCFHPKKDFIDFLNNYELDQLRPHQEKPRHIRRREQLENSPQIR